MKKITKIFILTSIIFIVLGIFWDKSIIVKAEILGADAELLIVKARITGVRQFTKTESNCVTIPGRTIISSTSTNRVEEEYTKCNTRQVAMVEYKFYSDIESALLYQEGLGDEIFRDDMSVHYQKGDIVTAVFDSPKPKFQKVNGEWRDLNYKEIDQEAYELTVAPISYFLGIEKAYADETFNSDGNFTPSVDDHTVLVIGGGGGGGGTSGDNQNGGGGGGAGGFVEQALTITATQSITVGSGGAGFSGGNPGGRGLQGATSSIGSLLEINGGGGGGHQDGGNVDGTNGASGGGGGSGDTSGSGGVGFTGGNDGGNGFGNGNGALRAGGGGGGATVAGGNGTSGTRGSGGTGDESSLSGSEVTYSAGGNGAQTGDGNGANGSANTGFGGVGGFQGTGGNGGSGIVIITFTPAAADHFFPSFIFNNLIPVEIAWK